MLPQPADFEENNDIRASSKKNAGVWSADVHCGSWWGVADERIYFYVRGDALTLNGATGNIYKCLMIFIKKYNCALVMKWLHLGSGGGVIPSIIIDLLTACVENSNYYHFRNNDNFQKVFPSSC